MNQQIVNGIEHLPQIMRSVNCTKLFLVAGPSFSTINIREQVESLGVAKVRFSDITPNPLYEQICRGVELFKAEQCDAILAVGGGSPIDVAKCIKLSVGSSLPFIAIPTTAGSGSESTRYAVIYRDGVKQTVTGDAIVPDYAILEPSVLHSLPLYQKKCTMMDALCLAIEAWWSIYSTAESCEYSQKTIELIMANWEKYIFENDSNAAARIMPAANYSGRAINITATTAAHAMSYKLASIFHIPHGHAVALCLPELWQYMIDHIDRCIDKRGSAYLSNTLETIANTMGVKSSSEAILLFRNMMNRMELGHPTSEHKEEALQELSTSVDPVRLKNHPVSLDTQVAHDLYNSIIN